MALVMWRLGELLGGQETLKTEKLVCVRDESVTANPLVIWLVLNSEVVSFGTAQEYS